MPLYCYFNPVSGRIVEMIRPIALRDAVPSPLVRVMTAPTVLRDNPLRGEPVRDCGAAVLNGFREIESKRGTAFVERETGFSAKQIKEAWGTVAPVDREEGVCYG